MKDHLKMDPLRPVSTMEPIITKLIWDTEYYPPSLSIKTHTRDLGSSMGFYQWIKKRMKK
jgi:hypothetical protein